MPVATTAGRVRDALAAHQDFVTVDDLCKLVFGRVGERERSAVYLAIHKMGDEVEKRAAGYRKRR